MTAFRNRDAVLRTRSARARRGITALALLLHRATTPPRRLARAARNARHWTWQGRAALENCVAGRRAWHITFAETADVYVMRCTRVVMIKFLASPPPSPPNHLTNIIVSRLVGLPVGTYYVCVSHLMYSWKYVERVRAARVTHPPFPQILLYKRMRQSTREMMTRRVGRIRPKIRVRVTRSLLYNTISRRERAQLWSYASEGTEITVLYNLP